MLKKSIETVKKVTQVAPRTKAELQRDAKQLIRLERLIDVIFAILIWMIFQNLPVPSVEEFDRLSNDELLSTYLNSFVMIFIGMFLAITYWGQNNRVFGNLIRTDGRHAVISLLQLVFLLLYLYTIGFEVEFPGHPIALAGQSVTLALCGYMAVIGWAYAKKNMRLISDVISSEEADQLKISIFAEPLAATFTIPFAFVGAGAWNLSWLSLIFFSWWLKRRHKSKIDVQQGSSSS